MSGVFIPRTLRRYPTGEGGAAGAGDGSRDNNDDGAQQCQRFFGLVLERLAVNQFVYMVEWCLRWALVTLGLVWVLYFLLNGGGMAILDWLFPSAPRPNRTLSIVELPNVDRQTPRMARRAIARGPGPGGNNNGPPPRRILPARVLRYGGSYTDQMCKLAFGTRSLKRTPYFRRVQSVRPSVQFCTKPLI